MRARSRISAMRPEMIAALCFALSASSDGVQRGLRILDHQQPRGTEGDHAVADFRADRAAAAGDDDGLAADELFQSAVVDPDARPQQQVLDRDRRELHRRAAGVERRHLAHRQTQLARADEDRFRPRFRRQRRGRQHQPRHMRAARGEIGDHAFEIVDIAQHGNAANRLAAVGGGRRQHAGRPDFLHRAAFDAAQQHFGVGCAAEHQRRRRIGDAGALQRARVMEIAVGDARAAEEKYLQQPIQQNGDLAEVEGAIEARRQQHVIERDQRHRQDGGDAENIEEVGNGSEAPLVAVQVEDEINDRGVSQEQRQILEPDQPLIERLVLEADQEGQHDRRGGGGKIVQYDQDLARRQPW